jgi:hypothetical protein
MENELRDLPQPELGDIDYIPMLYHAMYDKAIELTEREIENGNINKNDWLKYVDLHVKIMVVMHSDICAMGNIEFTSDEILEGDEI